MRQSPEEAEISPNLVEAQAQILPLKCLHLSMRLHRSESSRSRRGARGPVACLTLICSSASILRTCLAQARTHNMSATSIGLEPEALVLTTAVNVLGPLHASWVGGMSKKEAAVVKPDLQFLEGVSVNLVYANLIVRRAKLQ